MFLAVFPGLYPAVSGDDGILVEQIEVICIDDDCWPTHEGRVSQTEISWDLRVYNIVWYIGP